MENILCPKCGKENEPGSSYCNHCGAPLSETVPQADIKNDFPSAAVLPEIQPHKKSRKGLWILLGVCACVVIVCLVAAVLVGTGVLNEWQPVTDRLDTFVEFMVAKDVESAYALIEPAAKTSIHQSDLQSLISDSNYQQYFEGYQSLALTHLDVTFGNPKTAEASGTLTYRDGSGTFTANLAKVNDTWMIRGIHLNKDISD